VEQEWARAGTTGWRGRVQALRRPGVVRRRGPKKALGDVKEKASRNARRGVYA